MSDMTKGKSAADVTNVPAGLDMTITQPGTIVGGHDLQGTDGTTRTDRPGELLGTPALAATTVGHLKKGRELESAKHDYITTEVDRANREELPRLGGQVDDNWVAGDSKGTPAKAVAPVAATPQPAPVAHPETLTPNAKAADSGIRVSPKIDRG